MVLDTNIKTLYNITNKAAKTIHSQHFTDVGPHHHRSCGLQKSVMSEALPMTIRYINQELECSPMWDCVGPGQVPDEITPAVLGVVPNQLGGADGRYTIGGRYSTPSVAGAVHHR